MALTSMCTTKVLLERPQCSTKWQRNILSICYSVFIFFFFFFCQCYIKVSFASGGWFNILSGIIHQMTQQTLHQCSVKMMAGVRKKSSTLSWAVNLNETIHNIEMFSENIILYMLSSFIVKEGFFSSSCDTLLNQHASRGKLLYELIVPNDLLYRIFFFSLDIYKLL